jgi:hypothetical protein
MPGVLAVDALIGKVRKIDDTGIDAHRASAILVDARASIKRRRIDVRHGSVWSAPDDDIAACLGWPGLDPVDVVAIEGKLDQPDRAFDKELGCNGRCP